MRFSTDRHARRFWPVRYASLVAPICFMIVATAIAQTPRTLSTSDKRSIDETLDAFGTTLTKMDFGAFGALFTDDCDFVNIVGMHWVGKAQVVKAHSIVFTTRYRGVPQHILDKSEALLAPGVVLVTTTVKMDDYTAQDGKRMTNNLFRITWVFEKQDGKWLIRSAHNTSIDTEAAKHDPVKQP
jgi:uncharacterized protein (TIGR02246 family)